MSDSDLEPNHAYSFWWPKLTAILTAISVVNLTRSYFEIGIVPLLGELLDFYEAIFHYPFELIADVSGLAMPDWYRDLWIISFVFIVALARTLTRHERTRPTTAKSDVKALVVSITWKALLASTLFGLLVPLIYVAIFFRLPDGDLYREAKSAREEVLPDARYFFWFLFHTIIVATAFFAVNRGLTS